MEMTNSQSPTQPRHQKGESVGDYRLDSHLGSGAFGEVWKAGHRTLPDQVVAVKFPHLPEYVDKLKQEAIVHEKLHHPRIVHFLHYSTYGGETCLVMEYVDGESLDRWLAREGALDPEVAGEIAYQILEAIDHAHESGVIHRDLKPSNILVHRDQEGKLSVKVSDFGLGKVIEEVSMYHSLDSSRSQASLVGTLGYMSPEQIEGKKATSQSDLYSLGVIFYEMLTNQKGKLKFPISGVSRRINDIVNRATESDPDNRYPNAREMSQHLASCLHRDRVDGRTESWEGVGVPKTPPQVQGEDPLVYLLLTALFCAPAVFLYWQGFSIAVIVTIYLILLTIAFNLFF